MSIYPGTVAGTWYDLMSNTEGQIYNTKSFTVTASNPAPSISSVNGGNPVVADPGNAVQTISISGANFVNKPTVFVTWTGGSKTLSSTQVTFTSSTQLQMSIQLGTVAD